MRSNTRFAASQEPRNRRIRRLRPVAAPATVLAGWIGILGNGLCKSETPTPFFFKKEKAAEQKERVKKI